LENFIGSRNGVYLQALDQSSVAHRNLSCKL